MVSHPKTPILNCFYHLLWSYFVTVSEFSFFCQVIFCVVLTSMPLSPNQHHSTQKSAHEVPNAISESRVRSIFI